jgi:hypothetical protein
VNWNDPNAQWEGVGTGWYYSVLGGGASRRSKLPQAATPRTPVGVDNTNIAFPQMRGDFAVPTLFNGNFDAELHDATKPIPGWSLFDSSNNRIDTAQNHLKTWTEIGNLNPANYNNNYALKLLSNQSITHNPLALQSDWTKINFGLFVPDISGGGRLQVKMKEHSNTAWTNSDNLSTVGLWKRNATKIDREIQTGVDIALGNDPKIIGYRSNQIGYGNLGFETFLLDIPQSLRGKVIDLQFSLEGGATTAYLDNISFVDPHLKFGNPSGAVFDEAVRNNYLMEKPSYAVSYNDNRKIPNWVSWQLNAEWVNKLAVRQDTFRVDYTLPVETIDGSGNPIWQRVKANDMNRTANNGLSYERGHLTSSNDRRRSIKDNADTFFLTNMVPQKDEINDPTWKALESYCQNLASNGRELYIIALVVQKTIFPNKQMT